MTRISIENVAYYHSHQYTSLQVLKEPGEMHGARRVVVFCLLIAVLPTTLLIVSLYLRHSVYADVQYAVAESDVLEVVDGMSTVFCQEQVLMMNTSFHAFQLKGVPKLSHNKKHIHLKKTMVLPDDTLEYWGFFMLRGSQLNIKACARYPGARVMMVEGEKNLRTCGLMQHQKYPPDRSHIVGEHILSVPPVTTPPAPPTTTALPIQQTTIPPLIATEKEEDFEGENASDEDKNDKEPELSEAEIKLLKEKAISYLRKHFHTSSSSPNKTKSTEDNSLDYSEDDDSEGRNATSADSVSKDSKEVGNLKHRPRRKVRHAKSRLLDMEKDHGISNIDRSKSTEWAHRRARLQDTLNQEHKPRIKQSEMERRTRRKRDIKAGIMLDGGIGHGGNAGNFSDLEEESSESSFELNLKSCYRDRDIFTLDISPSHSCTRENLNSEYTYNVTSDGYYYFIFYSDNDFYQNNIHASFDIFKVTYEFTNYTRGCINRTECSFPITFWSDDIVIAEIPTQDGIEHEDDHMSILVSTCYPRMSVYIIFPVTVLFLILGCAFL